MAQKIDTIIFDIGGVLVDWKPEYVYRKAFNNDEQKVQWFLKNVCTPEWNMEQDAGRPIAEGNAIKIAEFPEYESYITLFYKEWIHMFSGPIQENLHLLKQLKASGNYKIYALTNWCDEKWEITLKLFPFITDFDGVVVSGKEKTRKPFPEIYNILLKRFHISPEKALFIDDNLDNILAAQKQHIHSIHYLNHPQLLKELKTFDINFQL